MTIKNRSLFNLLFLLIFLFLSLGINFFHTETTPESQQKCPACHFQNSTLLSAHIHFGYLPQLTQLGIIGRFEAFPGPQLLFTLPLSRSPPLG
ncbi:MAG: hypothetical protein ACOC5U_01705 [Candidatus Aminicenantaceae bacterium]